MFTDFKALINTTHENISLCWITNLRCLTYSYEFYRFFHAYKKFNNKQSLTCGMFSTTMRKGLLMLLNLFSRTHQDPFAKPDLSPKTSSMCLMTQNMVSHIEVLNYKKTTNK
jgi:hypothetical protein